MARSWRRRTVKGLWVVAALVILALGARIAMPFALHGYLNRLLAHNPNYTGTVGSVDVRLYRGAYKIHEVDIRKRGGKAPVPFLKAPLIDVSLEWRSIVRGRVVGKVYLEQPELNFVAGPTAAQSQSGNEGQWKKLVQALFPTQINRFEVSDGKVHFRNFHTSPNVDVALTHFDLIAQDLSRSGNEGEKRPGHVEMRGEFVPTGHMVLHVALDPKASAPSFDSDFVLKGVELAQWNDFLHAYTKVDVNQGTLTLFGEMAAEQGSFHGYLKPFFKDVQVIEWQDVAKLNLLSTAWRAFVQGVIDAFRNPESKEVASRIPITGEVRPRGEFWPALGSALYNAFIQGLAPRLERSVGAKG
jgi:uncharacterized protein DUF748